MENKPSIGRIIVLYIRNCRESRKVYYILLGLRMEKWATIMEYRNHKKDKNNMALKQLYNSVELHDCWI